MLLWPGPSGRINAASVTAIKNGPSGRLVNRAVRKYAVMAKAALVTAFARPIPTFKHPARCKASTKSENG